MGGKTPGFVVVVSQSLGTQAAADIEAGAATSVRLAAPAPGSITWADIESSSAATASVASRQLPWRVDRWWLSGCRQLCQMRFILLPLLTG